MKARCVFMLLCCSIFLGVFSGCSREVKLTKENLGDYLSVEQVFKADSESVIKGSVFIRCYPINDVSFRNVRIQIKVKYKYLYDTFSEKDVEIVLPVNGYYGYEKLDKKLCDVLHSDLLFGKGYSIEITDVSGSVVKK